MSRNFICTECGGKMEIGIIVDVGHGGFPADASYWMEGTNEKGSWLGLPSGLKTEGKKKHYISALRCERCGFLKFYAGPDNSEANR
jgi:hypothetical protein